MFVRNVEFKKHYETCLWLYSGLGPFGDIGFIFNIGAITFVIYSLRSPAFSTVGIFSSNSQIIAGIYHNMSKYLDDRGVPCLFSD